MADDTLVKAVERTVTGSSAARRLRKKGVLPCNLSTDEQGARSLQMNLHDFEMMLKHHSSENLVLDLQVGDEKPIKVLLRDVQHDSVTDYACHADFVEVSMTRKMRVDVPISLTGEPVGVTQTGGVLEHLLRELEVECLPGDIVESFPVDVSGLNIGDSILVGALDTPDTWQVLTDGEIAVASVAAPRLEEEPAAEEAGETAEAGEPEVIGEKEGESDEKRKKES